MDNGGSVVGRGGVNHRGSVVGRGGMDHRGSVVGSGMMDSVDSVGNNTVSTVQSVGGISNDGSVGSEGLALGGGPVLSLVRFAH